MRILFTLIVILLSFASAQAVDVGFFRRADCGDLTPVANQTVCLQGTTVSGRTAGTLYSYTGTWDAVGTSALTEVQGTANETAVTSGAGPIPIVGLATDIVRPAGSTLTATGTGKIRSTSVATVKYSTEFDWTQSPSGTIAVGANTVTLTPVPAGVNGDNMAHYLYIAGTGTPEVVLITGGTAVAGAASGTIEFTAANTHDAGFTIASSTVGAQEAVWDTSLGSGADGKFDGKIVIPPGSVTWQGPLHVRATNVEVSAYGVRLTCNYAGDCLTLGGPANGGNDYTGLRLRGLMILPGTSSSAYSAIVDSAQGAMIEDLALRTNSTNRFLYGIKVLNDQAAHINRFNANGGGAVIQCDTTTCGSAIYAPGPFATYAAVGWITNGDISNNCSGNGIDWQSGNSLDIKNTVIQAWDEFALRVGTAGGGFQGAKLDNVYMERGACGNHPDSNIGSAGVILQGGKLEMHGGTMPGDMQPLFANTGATYWHYHVVARTGAYFSTPLPAGYATVDTTSAVTVTWPPIAGATSYDLLRTTYDPATDVKNAPSGTGNYSIGTTLLPATYCTASLCTFTDTPIVPSSYTVQAGQAVQYLPKLDFWPGTVVIGASEDSTGADFEGKVGLYQGDHPGYLVNIAPINYVNVLYTSGGLASGITSDSSGYSPSRAFSLIPSSLAGGIANEHSGTLLGNVGGTAVVSGLKGRLNFGGLGDASFPLDILTLYDADFAKTWSYSNQRPPYTAGDTAIGRDSAADSFAVRAGTTISQYINSAPDGTSWKTRLTSSLFTIIPTVNLDSLTASKCVATDASKNLVSSAADCNTIAAGAVGATEIDETDDYVFTGTIFTTTTVASLGTATDGVFKSITDANPDCLTGGGSTVRLCRGNGATWDTIGNSGDVTAGAALTSTAFVTGGGSKAVQTPSATSTLDASGNAVFAGSVTADSFSLGGASTSCDGTAGCYEMGQGTAPSGAPTANTIRHYAPTGVTAYSIIHPTTAATGYRYLSNSSGTMTETIVPIVKSVQIEVFAPTTATSTGDGKRYFRIPSTLNGYVLSAMSANVIAAGTTGTLSIGLDRCAATTAGAICTGTGTSIVNMLTTNSTIDSGENDTTTAATPVDIDETNDDVATGQVLRINIDAIHTTPATGLILNLDFTLP